MSIVQFCFYCILNVLMLVLIRFCKFLSYFHLFLLLLSFLLFFTVQFFIQNFSSGAFGKSLDAKLAFLKTKNDTNFDIFLFFFASFCSFLLCKLAMFCNGVWLARCSSVTEILVESLEVFRPCQILI